MMMIYSYQKQCVPSPFLHLIGSNAAQGVNVLPELGLGHYTNE